MMNTLLTKLLLWTRDEKGATAIEYGLIAAGVAVAIAVAVFALGDDLNGLFGDVSTELNRRPS